MRKTLYMDCDKRYCIDRTYFNHDTGQKRYTRFYHLDFSVMSTSKGAVTHNGRLLSLGSVGRDRGLRTLLSTNTSSLGVRKQLGSITCMGGIATCCHRGLSTVFGHHGRCVHTSSNAIHLTFHPRLSGDFDENFASCFLRKHAPSVFSFRAPGSLNRRVKIIGRMHNGCFAITNIGPFDGNSKLYCLSRTKGLRKFQMGHMRGGGLCPRRVPHLQPGAGLCHGFSRRFRQIVRGGSTRQGVTITVTLRRGGFKFALALASRSSGDVDIALPCRGTPTHAPRTRGLEGRLNGLKGAPFRLRHLSVSLSNS